MMSEPEIAMTEENVNDAISIFEMSSGVAPAASVPRAKNWA